MSIIEFDFGVAADSAYDEDGHLEIGLDHYGSVDKAGGAKATAVHPYGFASRPLDPKKAGDDIAEGCGLLVVADGDRLNVMPIEDQRTVDKLPKLRKGGSYQYCSDGGFAMFEGEDPAGVVRPGSYVVSTKYGSKAHVFRLDKRKDGKEQVTLTHGEGHGLVLNGEKSAMLRNAAGNGYFETNNDGNVIAGKTKIVGACTVGEPIAAMPLVLSTPLIAIFTQLFLVLATMADKIPSIPPPELAAIKAQLAALQVQLLALPAKMMKAM